MGELRFDDKGERIHDLPWCTLDFGEEPLTVHYLDTWIREYRDDPQMNHIEWCNEEGTVVAISIPQESIALMKQLGFRQSMEIIAGKSVEDWFVRLCLHDVSVEQVTVPQEWS